MTAVISVVALLAVFLLMGWLTTPPGNRNDRWRRTLMFLGAVGLGSALVLLGFAVLLAVVTALGALDLWLNLGIGLFTGTLIIVLLAGALLFAACQPLLRRLRVSMQTLTIVEYYIQWLLIYVTIYQVVVDQLSGVRGLIGDVELEREVQGYLATVLDPSFLIVLLLPVLISVWVAVAIAKLRIDADHDAHDAHTLRLLPPVRHRTPDSGQQGKN